MSNLVDLSREFQLDSQAHQAVLKELDSLCQMFSLTVAELRYKWESFALSLMKGNEKPTIDLLRQLRKNLEKQVNQPSTKTNNLNRKARPAPSRMLSSLASDFMDVDSNQEDSLDQFMTNLTQGTSVYAKPTPSTHANLAPIAPTLNLQASQSTSSFSERKGTNVIDLQLNPQLSFRSGPSAKPTITNSHPKILRYRYMFEKIRNKAEMLDDQIDYMADIIQEANQWEEGYGNPTRTTQGSIKAVGRICNEANQGKLNHTSVMLESSRTLGLGKRVKLDLTRIPDFSLFPGQIVGFQGNNMTGKSFVVEQIVTPPLPERIQAEEMGRNVDVLVASGPFTLDSDLSFEPLVELLQTCVATQPDVLLLMGPFLSTSHPTIAKGDIDELPEDLFQREITSRLNQLAQAQPDTKIVLMPHANDIVHEWPLFPQPSLSAKALQLDPSILLLPNPSVISINGTTLAMANVDILMALGQQECSKASGSQDRLARLSHHILQQRSFYPLYPTAPDVIIDADQMAMVQLTTLPDILVLPSHLKHFAKVVDDVICMNPGHLCKSQSGGTYARIALPAKQHVKQHEHIRVDLIKI
ncbi:DNA polymerase alpha, subunit B [Hesseltinella vesiculosa]|uniref:DNA polymerase alpha subunit B n=1 Tax=Hesseltinella vesiculosa TaxID=101127 RepID=A0A1X2G538_9FUNG|nr:DNA polymerase alpha, subunit B [Hesseltinella vesiculosa]